MGNPNAYREKGYQNREEYLQALCLEYPEDVVHALADVLGPEEDFDGLLTMLNYGEGFYC